MPTHRPTNWIALIALAAAVVDPACSTGAVGIDECRRIEYARCEAAPTCPDQFNVGDVEECKLFYRDQCLHGLSVANPPNASSVNACVDAIDELAKCAKAHGAKSLLTDCKASPTSLKPKLTTVCKLMEAPDAIAECSFLGGNSSATGGQSGTGGGTSVGGTSASSTGAGGTSATTDNSGLGGLEALLGIGGLTL